MWFKHRAWVPIAWLLTFVNVVAVWFAARPGETWHAAGHALFGVLFAVGAMRLKARQQSAVRVDAALGDDRMKGLEVAIDAIAIELERVGEGQRFVTKMMAERGIAIDRAAAPRKDP